MCVPWVILGLHLRRTFYPISVKYGAVGPPPSVPNPLYIFPHLCSLQSLGNDDFPHGLKYENCADLVQEGADSELERVGDGGALHLRCTVTLGSV